MAVESHARAGIEGWSVRPEERVVCTGCHCDMPYWEWQDHIASERHRLRAEAHQKLERKLAADPRTA